MSNKPMGASRPPTSVAESQDWLDDESRKEGSRESTKGLLTVFAFFVWVVLVLKLMFDLVTWILFR